MYDHRKQYRAAIIRGKAKSKLDDLLPAYAMVIDEICPCNKDEFEQRFNSSLTSILKLKAKESNSAAIKKTLDNHRTEIAGKLFGMYYLSRDDVYYASERTNKYLADNDQPAFFKDMCFKLQFPNGMNKIQFVEQFVNEKLSIRQYPFIIKVLHLAEQNKLRLTVADIGYYVLNSLDVLQGNATPEEVISQIIDDKRNGISRKIYVPDKASSYTMQHITEQMNYLQLANLIYLNENKEIMLNHKEDECLNLFMSQCGVAPSFNTYTYDLDTQDGRNDFYYDWDLYFSKTSVFADKFETAVDSLIVNEPSTDEKEKQHSTSGNLTELGDAGELFVYQYERNRVFAFNPRLVNKVLPLGKTKGLGYDIQSVVAEKGEYAEFVKYIEVKSTKRVTAPNLNDGEWLDTLNITRNEYIAAMQHKESYSIYRVYFVRDGVVVFILNNIHKKNEDGIISMVPTVYRLDFSKSAIDNHIEVRNV